MKCYKITPGTADTNATELESIPASATGNEIILIIGTAVNAAYTADIKTAVDALLRKANDTTRIEAAWDAA